MIAQRRFVILGLIAVTTMLNHLDRALIGVAAPLISQDLGLNAVEMGFIFSAFPWSYVAAQLPFGALLDRTGPRLTYFLSIATWSAFTALQGLCTGAYSSIAIRLGLGAAEAPCFPVASRIVAVWFPQSERARATSLYTVGEYIGVATVGPFLYWAMPVFGWRSLFAFIGLAGIAFAIVWWRIYRDPYEDPRASSSELELIRAGGGLVQRSSPPAYTWAAILRLLSFRQVWGAGIGAFAGNATLVFFLTWYPTYLETQRGLDFKQLAYVATLPYATAAAGILSGGYISDMLIKWTGSVNLGRKLPVIIGLLLMSGVAGANYVENDVALIAIMAVAFFGQGLVGIGWTVISDIAPEGYLGVTAGLFNIIANSSAIVAPIGIGFILAATGSFVLSLFAMSIVGLFGAFAISSFLATFTGWNSETLSAQPLRFVLCDRGKTSRGFAHPPQLE